MKHADAWKSEEDPGKRGLRLHNLVELFKICELLQSVVVEQIQSPLLQSETELDEESKDNDSPTTILASKDLSNSSGKKKRKVKKQKKDSDFEKLSAEARRLAEVPENDKPYVAKNESDSKIIKFAKVPKN